MEITINSLSLKVGDDCLPGLYTYSDMLLLSFIPVYSHMFNFMGFCTVYRFIQVSPIIIKTVISIQSAFNRTMETTEEIESPVPADMWEKRDWKDLKLWFLEEQGEASMKAAAPLIPQGESLKVKALIIVRLKEGFPLFNRLPILHLQMNIKSICVTLEAGVGHRTVPMLLAKSSFQGDVKNWSTLINLKSELNLEVRQI